MKKLTHAILAGLILTPAIALADTASDADIVKKAMDYYHNGEAAVLIDYKFCSEIIKEGENKNECAEVVDAAAIAEDSKVYLWMNFFVPGDKAEKVHAMVQYGWKGRVMDNSDITLSQSFRYRTWRLIPTKKAGDWTVSVEQEGESAFMNLAKFSYTVAETVAETEVSEGTAVTASAAE